MRQRVIGAGFALLGATRLHRLGPRSLRGLGAILMFHHVRPYTPRDFAPNRLLEIEPGFLEAVIERLRALRYDILPLDEAVARIEAGTAGARRFAVLTFDDGYRDFSHYALPILERHTAPFTLFVTAGFADGDAPLWWLDLEEAVVRATTIDWPVRAEARAGEPPGAACRTLPARTAAEKRAAFATIYAALRRGSEPELLDTVAALRARHAIDAEARVRRLCMDWPEIVALAGHRLATIGAHTLTHPRLGQIDEASMRREIAESRDRIVAAIGRPVRHLAYPVGGRDAVGAREFRAAAELGFASAVTTRPGLIFAEHRDHRTALPRLSVNGLWQNIDNFEVLLSGMAFALWNRGRRVVDG